MSTLLIHTFRSGCLKCLHERTGG